MSRGGAENARDLAENDDRQRQLTPQRLVGLIRADLGGTIALDPCTEPDNPTGAGVFYALPTDGAIEPWLDGTFVNPPYGLVRRRWVARCIVEGEAGKRIILLMPAATDTSPFQSGIRSAGEAVFLRSRLRFEVIRPNGRYETASHSSVVFAWNVELRRVAEMGSRLWLPAHSCAE